jgi:hypothetical protein
MKSKKLEKISFTKFSQMCDAHIQNADKRCFCDERTEDHIVLCNLANCPLYNVPTVEDGKDEYST